MREKSYPNIKQEGGVMLIEALVAILIFSVGILAVVGMQAVAIRDLTQSKYRNQAAFLANQILGQIWIDNTHIANYQYPVPPATPTPPQVLTNWASQVTNGTIQVGNSTYQVGPPMPGATANPPTITVTNPTANGGTVQVKVFWILPEEASQNPPLPPHNYTVTATVYTS